VRLLRLSHPDSGGLDRRLTQEDLTAQIDWILGFTFISPWIKWYMYIQQGFAMADTKLFKNGNSQAVRIPAELAYSTWDVDLVIKRQGDELRIRPAQLRMGDVLGKLAKFSPDFMARGRGENMEVIASFAQIAFVLVVSPKSPLNNITELVAHLKKKGDTLYGYTNQTAQLSSELFKQMTGVTTKPLPYRNTTDAMKEITEGSVDFCIMDGTFAAGQVAQGTLKALAVTTAQRSPSFPGIPTMQESGLPGFEFAPWWAAYAPVGTPKDVLAKLEGWFHEIAKQPETATFLQSVGAIVNDDGPAAADARLRAEMPKWEALVKAAGIEPQ
jgi:virulence-associated protein VagC